MMVRHLVIFAKAPRIGRAKTRLAKAIGKVPAQQFYRTQLNSLCHHLCGDPRWTVWLALTEQRDRDEHGWDTRANVIIQPAGDLGQRMGAMFDHLPAGPLVLIGSDIPDVTSNHIDQAFKALGRNDVVFGPGEDGGYWLVGMKRNRPIRGVFDSVRWSTSDALADTEKNLNGYAIAHLDVLPDIDNGEDYRRWQQRHHNGKDNGCTE